MKVVAFEVEVGGIKGLVDDWGSVREAIKATRKEIDTTNDPQALNKLIRQMGALKKLNSDFNAEVRQQGREFAIAADQGQGSYRAMNAELVNLRNTYKELSREERNGIAGKQALSRIQELDTEVKNIDRSLGNYQRNVGNYREAIESALAGQGSLFDNLSAATSNLLNPITLITGAVGGLVLVGNEIVNITERIRETRGETARLTGLIDDDLEEATARLTAISDTFGEDYTQTLIAANTLTQEVTGDFSKSLDLIQTGLLAGANANGEFLQGIREYSTQVREAGITGEQFTEILIRQTQEGIYSDKGIDAVKEAGLSIREQTQATRDALESAFGEEFTQQLFDEINDGSITTVEGIQRVSKALQDSELTAKQTQTVVADVFRGAGEDAGLRFLQILDDIDGELDDVIDKTNELTTRQLEQLRATERLNRAEQNLSDTFLTLNVNVDTFFTNLKSQFLEETSELLIELQGIAETTASFFTNFLNPAGFRITTEEDIRARGRNEGNRRRQEEEAQQQRKINEELATTRLSYAQLTERQKELQDAIRDATLNEENSLELRRQLDEVTRQLAAANTAAATSIRKVTEAVADTGSIESLNNRLKELNEELNKTGDEDRRFQLLEDISETEAELQEIEVLLESFRQSLDPVKLVEEGATEELEEARRILEESQQLQRQFREDSQAEIDNREEVVRQEERIAIESQERIQQFRADQRRQNALETITDEEQLQQELRRIEEDQQLAVLEFKLNNLQLEVDERIQAELEVAQIRREQSQREQEQASKQTEERKEEQLEAIQAVANFASQAAGAIFQIQRQRINSQEKEAIKAAEAEYGRRIDLAEGNEQEQERLEQELDQRRQQIEKQAGQRRKAQAIKEALVETALAVLRAAPNPFLIAATVALGAIQVAAISAQQFAKGGSIEKSTNNVRSIFANTGASILKRGVSGGRRHSGGGNHGIIHGRHVEWEQGEFIDTDENGNVVIVNRKSTDKFRGTLQAIGGKSFQGKSALLSSINSFNGYGTTFAQEGALIPNTSFLTPNTSSATGTTGSGLVLSEESIALIGAAVQVGAEVGTETGAATGISENRQLQERRARQARRLGITN